MRSLSQDGKQWLFPSSLAELFDLLERNPGVRLVAGNTGVT